MRILKTNYLPPKRFKGLNFFGILLVRKGTQIDELMLNHERIHTKQIEEVTITLSPLFLLLAIHAHWLFVVPMIGSFYIWYGVEWLVRLLKCKNGHKAYRNISFEREAYDNQSNPLYLSVDRKRFAFLKYIKR